MKFHKLSVFGAVVVLTASVSSCAQLMGQDAAPFGGPDSAAFADALWAELLDANLVGPDAVRPFPYEGGAPHGAVLATMESTLTVDGITGAVIVKKNYTADGGTVASVSNDPMQQHDVTVMFAREDGYDADDNNWF